MLKKTGFRILATLALALVAVANQSQAEALSALSAGSPYILVFVTSDTINAMSSTIGDYNTFVTTEANLNPALMALGTTWSVIGSTPDTNAIANIGSNPGIPIFDVNGNQIAVNDTTSGLFSGSLLNPILYDENGVANPTNVWTGTNAGGTTYSYLGGLTPNFGSSEASVDGTWINDGDQANTNGLSLYAISGTLEVAAPGPLRRGFPFARSMPFPEPWKSQHRNLRPLS